MAIDIFLATQITRNAEPFDVVIHFRCTHYHPGCPADLWGPAPHPADPPEGEFETTNIEFDPVEPDAAPLTDAERAELTAWFHSPAGYELAMEQYAEAAVDDEPDPDEARDRMLDERMERMECGA